MDHNEDGCQCAACTANNMIETIDSIIEAIECDCPVCKMIKSELTVNRSALASILGAVAVMYPDPDPHKCAAIEAHLMGIVTTMASMINSYSSLRDAAHQGFDAILKNTLHQVAHALQKQGVDAKLATFSADEICQTSDPSKLN
jgi:hypothetical protein